MWFSISIKWTIKWKLLFDCKTIEIDKFYVFRKPETVKSQYHKYEDGSRRFTLSMNSHFHPACSHTWFFIFKNIPHCPIAPAALVFHFMQLKQQLLAPQLQQPIPVLQKSINIDNKICCLWNEYAISEHFATHQPNTCFYKFLLNRQLSTINYRPLHLLTAKLAQILQRKIESNLLRKISLCLLTQVSSSVSSIFLSNVTDQKQ